MKIDEDMMSGGVERLVRIVGLAVIPAIPLGFFAFLDGPSDGQRAVLILAGALGAPILGLGLLGRRCPSPLIPRRWQIGGGWALAALILGGLRAPDGVNLAPILGLSLAAFVFWGLFALSIREAADLNRYRAGWGWVGAVLAILGILNGLGVGVREGVPGKMAVGSLFGHPNHLASALGPLVFLILGGGGGGRLGRWLRGVGVFVLLMALVFTGARGIWLGLMVGAVYLFLRRRGRFGAGPLISFRRMLTIGFFLILVIPVVFPTPWSRPVYDLGERLRGRVEIQSRLFSWLIATDMIAEAPFLGHGVGAYDALFWSYVSKRQKRDDWGLWEDAVTRMNAVPPEHPHNEWLSLMTEQGLPGLAAWIFLFLLAGGIGPRAPRERQGQTRNNPMNPNDWTDYLRSALLVVFVDSLFMFPFHLPFSLLLVFFLLAALARLSAMPDLS